MSELFDKQNECIKGEFEKTFWDSHKLLQVHEKRAKKMKIERKNNAHLKYFKKFIRVCRKVINNHGSKLLLKICSSL